MSIKHWDNSLQPRQKALNYGFESLSDSELLAIVLKSGYQGVSSVALANQILTKMGGLAGLMHLSLEELMTIKGIKLAKATQILAYLELAKRISWSNCQGADYIVNPDSIVEWLKKSIGLSLNEYFVVIYLNNQNKVIGHLMLSNGNVSEVHLSTSEIFKKALLKKSNKIVLAHNHPSGNLIPSLADKQMTNNLVKAAEILHIEILDHLIVSNDGTYSFKQYGLI